VTDTVDAAVSRAVSASAALVAADRAHLLRTMAGELEKDGDVVVDTADRETALGTPRLAGELARSAFQLRLFADVLDDGGYLDVTIDHADPAAVPAPRPDLRRMMVPLGPVAVFAASNFPLAFSVPGGDTASALAAGCPVIVKAHPGHPDTSALCATALRRAAASAGLPEDVVQVVYGFEAGPRLVTHPAIEAVGFTGSVAGGRALHDLAAARPRPIPFHGELGSINPLVVTPAAAAERAAEIAVGLAQSFTMGTGQFCTKPGLAFVPAGSSLVAELAAAAAGVATGRMLTDGIRDAFAAGAASRAALPGVRAVLTGAGSPWVLATPASTLDERLLDECFGPLIVVAEYGSAEELLAAVDRVPGALTGTVHCGAREAAGGIADEVARRLAARVGRVVFNGFPTGVAVTWAQQHGGPYPSSTSAAHTSVGTAAIRRFLRPVAFQDTPEALLPAALRDDNPLRLPRRVDGRLDLAT
jgi:NADP-dependent aldehyde dehydrogenase